MEGAHHPSRVGYDRNNPKVRALVWFAIWFTIVMILILAVTWVVYRGITKAFERDSQPNNAFADQRPPPPEPRLQPSPSHDRLPQRDLQLMLQEENTEFV